MAAEEDGMTATIARLDRLTDRIAGLGRPSTCRRTGPYCAVAWHVRSDVDDPRNPPPATECPACGRPRLVRELVVVGVDPTLI